MTWIKLENRIFLEDEVASVQMEPQGSEGKMLNVILKGGGTFTLIDDEAEYVWEWFKKVSDVGGNWT